MDIVPNKIFISSFQAKRSVVNCPLCPCLFRLPRSWFFSPASRRHAGRAGRGHRPCCRAGRGGHGCGHRCQPSAPMSKHEVRAWEQCFRPPVPASMQKASHNSARRCPSIWGTDTARRDVDFRMSLLPDGDHVPVTSDLVLAFFSYFCTTTSHVDLGPAGVGPSPTSAAVGMTSVVGTRATARKPPDAVAHGMHSGAAHR